MEYIPLNNLDLSPLIINWNFVIKIKSMKKCLSIVVIIVNLN